MYTKRNIIMYANDLLCELIGVLVSIAVANDSMCKNDSSWSSSNDSSQDFNR